MVLHALGILGEGDILHEVIDGFELVLQKPAARGTMAQLTQIRFLDNFEGPQVVPLLIILAELAVENLRALLKFLEKVDRVHAELKLDQVVLPEVVPKEVLEGHPLLVV